MIPSITPPTDNLYKFISLFGLTIFLFSSYNLGVVYDQSATAKMQLEDLTVLVQQKIYSNTHALNSSLISDSTNANFRPSKVKKMESDLQVIRDAVNKSELNPIEKVELEGKIGKIKVRLDSIGLKQVICIAFVITGILVMIFGFLRWKKKEQDIRDKMLEIEHILKQQERDTKQKRKKNKKAILSSSKELEQQQGENEEVQNQSNEITSSSMN